MLTEQEAKDKWCPQVRMVFGPNNSGWEGQGYTNRADYYEPEACVCTGSNCMMWRWGNKYRSDLITKLPREEWTGYCGLAGKP